MIYKIEKNIIIIKDLLNDTVYRVNLDEIGFKYNFLNISSAVMDFKNERIGFFFFSKDKSEPFQSGILLRDLKENHIERIDINDGLFNIAFDNINPNLIYVNTGHAVIRYYIKERKKERIFGHKNIFFFDIKLSENGKYLLFTKNKSDTKVLHLFDLSNNVIDSKISGVFKFDFLNDRDVIHSQHGGIKIFNFETKKNKVILTADSIIKKFKEHPIVERMFEISNIPCEIPSRKLKETDFIKLFCGRIYFTAAVWIACTENKINTLCSVNTNLCDFKSHYSFPTEGAGFLGGEFNFYGNTEKLIFTVHKHNKRFVYNADRCYELEEGYLPVLYS